MPNHAIPYNSCYRTRNSTKTGIRKDEIHIVSNDVHLSDDMQIKLVESLKTILGDYLYQPKFDKTDWTDPTDVPTPAHFLNKVKI
ncbi:unnamed protein product [Bursaphelenchus okinawaensis]|uniref:Phosphatidylinositol-specific phospholipase C X domain-containing protein n=1 Tax=Bursaphelenchus okinawaensis TaxID=465554 RepID=A0A811KFH6_9BILA|nr:unnamed protein product [Bursaphelenchus okinawaensis]CAG9101149.1 unnamed protein product [Bursaphelenchus okinawaensis]